MNSYFSYAYLCALLLLGSSIAHAGDFAEGWLVVLGASLGNVAEEAGKAKSSKKNGEINVVEDIKKVMYTLEHYDDEIYQPANIGAMYFEIFRYSGFPGLDANKYMETPDESWDIASQQKWTEFIKALKDKWAEIELAKGTRSSQGAEIEFSRTNPGKGLAKATESVNNLVENGKIKKDIRNQDWFNNIKSADDLGDYALSQVPSGLMMAEHKYSAMIENNCKTGKPLV